MALNKNQSYLNNPNLKAAGVQVEFTGEQVTEYAKCAKDPIYFLENYGKIVSLDDGAVLFKLYPYQKRIIHALHNNRKIAAKLGRQMGKSSVTSGYIAWYVLFNGYKTAAILANKASIAKEIFSRVQFIIENLPLWLQQGVLEWNKTTFALENGSKCFCAASSPSSIRGKSINFLLCVSGDTEVTIKNKITGIIETIQIRKIAEYNIPIITNKDYQLFPHDYLVLTDTGFSEFSGLKITKSEKFYEVKFNSGNSIKITDGHRLLTTDGWIDTNNIKIGIACAGKDTNETITSIDEINGGLAYDLVGVKSNSRYYTNNIISHNCDEFAHLSNTLSEEFISSVFPTISASQESKLVLVSTPRGLNTFHKIWTEAEQGLNGFVICDGHWSEHPQRDQKWADEQRSILGELKYQQEIEATFLGSSMTLISGSKLATIPSINPIYDKDFLKIYHDPIPGHSYVCTVDTSRGQHLDYSAFVIFDITTLPYQVVATYKNNAISSMAYPFVIRRIAEKYNSAHILVEINDIGGQVADILHFDEEYENLYFTYKDDLTEGGGYPGVRTTKKVKSIGCATLKDFIEQDQLMVNSPDILQELTVFVQKGSSYAADDTTINDDLVACMWLFAWLTRQQLFLDLTNTNIRAILAKKTEQYIEENMIPFGMSSEVDLDDDFSEPVIQNQSDMDKWLFG